ncbi:MAG: vitamin B12 dependent-methionine synthase activation domain-containing protein [Bacteroidales bacterium]
MFEYKVSLSSIMPDKGEIAQKVGHDFVEEADKVLMRLSSIEAKGAFIIIDPSESGFHYGAKVKSAFSKAERVALFVASLGETSKRIINFYREDPLAYYMADFLASEFAEAMAGYMYGRIKEYALNFDWGCSNRYSPGYCGWSVKEQGILFGFFPKNSCGVRLSESFLMDPVKSVSGAIALGREVRYQEYGCKMCEEKNCLYKSKL